MFEKATRQKLRFDSPKGQLSVEDLWDLPLIGNTNKANLDDIAKGLHQQLKDDTGVSFVLETTAKDDVLTTKFELVKHIIQVKLAEQKAHALAKANADEKQKLLAIIADRKDAALKDIPLEELEARVKALC